MINATNDLGTRHTTRGAVLTGLVLTLVALALLARSADAQPSPQFDLIGTVVDADKGTALVGAWVSVTGSKWGSVTDDRGRFRIPDMDGGALSLTVEQLGYETLVWEGRVSERDGLLELSLTPTPLVLEGLQVVTDRFRARRNAVATTVRAFDPADLSTTTQQTALEFVTLRTGTWTTRCRGRYSDTCLYVRGRAVEPRVYLDEAPVLGGLEFLNHFAPHELYMIEVYGGGQHIRAYTPQFMERAAKQRLSPIALHF